MHFEFITTVYIYLIEFHVRNNKTVHLDAVEFWQVQLSIVKLKRFLQYIVLYVI